MLTMAPAVAFVCQIRNHERAGWPHYEQSRKRKLPSMS